MSKKQKPNAVDVVTAPYLKMDDAGFSDEMVKRIEAMAAEPVKPKTNSKFAAAVKADRKTRD